jgi:hypothetical protein
MNIQNILREALVGKKLLSVGKSTFKNAVILDIGLSGWEINDSDYNSSGVAITLWIEYDHGKQRRKDSKQIDDYQDFVIEQLEEEEVK